MWSLKDKFESCFQVFLVAHDEYITAAQIRKPFTLGPGIIGSANINGKIDTNKIYFPFDKIDFTADQFISIKKNMVNFLFGNLARATSEAFREHLNNNGYPGGPTKQLKSLNGNLKSLYVIISCLGNAYAHNSCEGTWNIIAAGYKQIWKFKHTSFPGTSSKINVDINLDLTNSDGLEINFDKDFGGFGNVCHLLFTCRRLFWGQINLSDI